MYPWDPKIQISLLESEISIISLRFLIQIQNYIYLGFQYMNIICLSNKNIFASVVIFGIIGESWAWFVSRFREGKEQDVKADNTRFPLVERESSPRDGGLRGCQV